MTTERGSAGNSAELAEVTYEVIDGSIARIMLDRPDSRNAQGLRMTYGLDAAFRRAAQDASIKVIILGGNGKDFSSGHDVSMTERNDPADFPSVSLWRNFDAEGWEGFYAREKEIYLEITERWRNIPKPTIAQVQGNCISGGLMLAWACDLIVAAADACFMETTLMMGICGTEFFNHPYELPLRKAKEWLFTADALSAQEALRHGMVNHVVPVGELSDFTLALARKIARKPMFALSLAKEALNASQDLAGRRNLMTTTFAMHHLCHAHNMLKGGFPADTSAFPPKLKARMDEYAANRGDKSTAEFTQMRRPDLPKG